MLNHLKGWELVVWHSQRIAFDSAQGNISMGLHGCVAGHSIEDLQHSRSEVLAKAHSKDCRNWHGSWFSQTQLDNGHPTVFSLKESQKQMKQRDHFTLACVRSLVKYLKICCHVMAKHAGVWAALRYPTRNQSYCNSAVVWDSGITLASPTDCYPTTPNQQLTTRIQ